MTVLTKREIRPNEAETVIQRQEGIGRQASQSGIAALHGQMVPGPASAKLAPESGAERPAGHQGLHRAAAMVGETSGEAEEMAGEVARKVGAEEGMAAAASEMAGVVGARKSGTAESGEQATLEIVAKNPVASDRWESQAARRLPVMTEMKT